MIITTNQTETNEQQVEVMNAPTAKKAIGSINISSQLFKKLGMLLLTIIAFFILLTVLVTSMVNGQIFANTISWAKILPVYENPQNGSNLTFLKLPVNKTKFSMLEIPSQYSENVILYLHGNAGRLEHFYNDMLPMGSVFSPSYPGYSESEGSPTMENAYETAMESYKYLVEVKKVPEDKIIILGHSLGGSVATYLASKKEKAGRLVIINTFSSIQSMCFRSANILCGLTGGTFNSAESAKNVKIPVTQFAYKGDTTIPFAEGEKLYTYFTSVEVSKKKFVETNNYAHSHPDFDLIRKELEPFLTIVAPQQVQTTPTVAPKQ